MELISNDIVNRISKAIRKAEYRIIVNVPWFTSEKLLDELINAAKKGVIVYLMIEDDNVNLRSGIDHSELLKYRGKLFWHKKKIGVNHEKYCIIDETIVIYGSFNWTFYADKHNNESVMIFDSNSMAEYKTVVEKFEKKFSQSLADTLNYTEQKNFIDTGELDLSKMLIVELSDLRGGIIVDDWVQDFDEYSCGLARIQQYDYFGFIDKENKMTIPPIFEMANHFCEGLAVVQMNQKWGAINTRGDFIHACVYDLCASHFLNGTVKAMIGAKDYFLYPNGERKRKD